MYSSPPDSQPLVSIITPSYNQAPYITQTIRSVLAQDYQTIEYLIVDGQSTDGSAAIIKDFAELAPQRIRWWASEPDSGQAEAINKGLQRADGDIVAWLNSDDFYIQGAVSQAVKAFQANPEVGLVFADAITIDAHGNPLNKLTFHTRRGWDLAELLRFHIICQPAVFMRRSVLQKAGFLDPSYHFMLDHHLWLRMAQHAPIKYISSPNNLGAGTTGLWAAARHHAEAKNVAQAKAFGDETLALLDWLQTQPDFKLWVESDRKRVFGGAYRLNARYLLDGGLPGAALASYARALFYWPQYTCHHWHRIIYALLGSLGLKSAAALIDRFRDKKSSTHGAQIAAELSAYNNQFKDDNWQ